jgi:hypothetical protein
VLDFPPFNINIQEFPETQQSTDSLNEAPSQTRKRKRPSKDGSHKEPKRRARQVSANDDQTISKPSGSSESKHGEQIHRLRDEIKQREADLSTARKRNMRLAIRLNHAERRISELVFVRYVIRERLGSVRKDWLMATEDLRTRDTVIRVFAGHIDEFDGESDE